MAIIIIEVRINFVKESLKLTTLDPSNSKLALTAKDSLFYLGQTCFRIIVYKDLEPRWVIFVK